MANPDPSPDANPIVFFDIALGGKLSRNFLLYIFLN